MSSGMDGKMEWKKKKEKLQKESPPKRGFFLKHV